MPNQTINGVELDSIIAGVPVMSTSQLCKALGFNVSLTLITETLGVEPDHQTKTGTFFTKNTFYLIVDRLKNHLDTFDSEPVF